MKLLMGLIGFIIFAISLPAASQSSDGKDLARAYFFERTLKSTKKTYACDAITVLAISDKVSIVKGLNEAQNLKLATIDGRTEFTFQRATDAARITSLVESNSIGLCQTLKHQADLKAAAEKATKAQLDAAVAQNNALNRQLNGGSPGAGGSSGSSAAGGAATGVAIIGLLKETRGDKKEADSAQARLDAEAQAELGKFNGGTQPVAGSQAGTAAGAAKPVPNTSVPRSDTSASAAVKPTTTVKPEAIVHPIGSDGTMFDPSKGQITMPGKDGGAPVTYQASYDDKGNLTTWKAEGHPDKSTSDLMGNAANDPEIQSGLDSLKSQSPEAAAAAREAVGSAGANATDALANQQKLATEQGAAYLNAQNEKFVMPQSGSYSCTAYAENLKNSVRLYAEAVKSCGTAAVAADNMCSISRSPKAQMVSKFMSLASLLLAKENSASNNCRGAGYYAGIAQAGMTGASLVCSGIKFGCDSLCATAKAKLAAVQGNIKALAGCSSVALGVSARSSASAKAAATAQNYVAAAEFEADAAIMLSHGNAAKAAAPMYEAEMARQTTLVSSRITQCQKYAADILDMGIQILSLQQNRKEAKACKDALARANAGGKTDGSANKVADLTMDQFCAQPGQAAVVPCKCRNNNSAEGCPGYVADTLSKEKAQASAGGANSQMGKGGAAQMASVGGINGALTKMNGGKKSGLSSEARAALGLSDVTDANAQGATAGQYTGTAAQGAAGELAAGIDAGAGGGSAAGSNGAGGSDATAGKKSDGKDKYGKFETIGGGGSFGGFGGFGKFGAEKIDPKTGKKIPVTAQEAAALVQRKIAAQEFQEQVTTASGKSNWDKVRERYDDAKNSLFDMP